nr:MAG TPA: hypothetical protein [Caudoviricetes sp.]
MTTDCCSFHRFQLFNALQMAILRCFCFIVRFFSLFNSL